MNSTTCAIYDGDMLDIAEENFQTKIVSAPNKFVLHLKTGCE